MVRAFVKGILLKRGPDGYTVTLALKSINPAALDSGGRVDVLVAGAGFEPATFGL